MLVHGAQSEGWRLLPVARRKPKRWGQFHSVTAIPQRQPLTKTFTMHRLPSTSTLQTTISHHRTTILMKGPAHFLTKPILENENDII